MSNAPGFDPLDVVTLRQVRTLIRTSSARGGVVFFALLYVLGSMFYGGMLVLGNIQGGYTWTVLWSGGPGTNPWNYPGLLVIAPWGVISLPFFATFAMLVVSVGVGLGMTVAFLLSVRLLKARNARTAGSTSIGAVAGLTPAMISLVTLGACCSTTAAATAGVGLVAQASGTTANTLLLNNWYLGVFQIVVVWIALIAQELLLVVYAGLFGPPSGEVAPRAARKVDVRFVAGATVRLALLVAGVLWSLSMIAEWTTVNPVTAGAGLWFQWIVQHQVLAGLAIAAAFFPAGTYRFLQAVRERTGFALPVLFLAAGLSVLYSPPPTSAWGFDGLVNQVLFVAGAPSAWGTISPGIVGGLALVLRWGFEYALLAGFTVAVALRPAGAFAPLRWSVEDSVPTLHSPTTANLSPGSSASAGVRTSADEPSGPLGSPAVLTRGP